MGDSVEPLKVLNVERLIESQLSSQGFVLLRVALLRAEHDRHRISRDQMDDQEDDDRDEQQDRD